MVFVTNNFQYNSTTSGYSISHNVHIERHSLCRRYDMESLTDPNTNVFLYEGALKADCVCVCDCVAFVMLFL